MDIFRVIIRFKTIINLVFNVSLFWFAAASQASVSYVASATTKTTSATSLTVTKPTGVTTNDVLIATITASRGDSTVSTFTPPAGWTLVGSQSSTTSTKSNAMSVYYRVATASEASSYTFAISSGLTGAVVGVSAYRGVDTSAPIDQKSGNGQSSRASFTTPGIAPTVSGGALLAMFSVDSSRTWTIAAAAAMTTAVNSYSNSSAGSGGISLATGYKLNPALASTSVSASITRSSDIGTTYILSLKPAAVVVTLDHIQIEHDGNGVTCAAEVIVVKACANSACSTLMPTAQTINLTATPSGSLGTSAIKWTSDATGNTTLASGSTLGLTFTGSTTAYLWVTSAGTVTLGSNATSSKCYVNSTQTCSLPFATSGFLISVIPTHTAGTTSASNITLQAITGTGGGGSCVGLSSGSKSVDLAFSCDDPSTCTSGVQLKVTNSTNTTTNVSGNNAGVSNLTYTAVPLNFNSSSQATFTLNYPDVGKLNLSARYSANSIYGNSNLFVVKPAGFSFTNIKSTANSAVTNPAATSATGGKFIAAGNDFSVTLSAINSSGGVAANFGNEATPEGALLDSALVAPVGGDAGSLAGSLSVDGVDFIAGVKTVTDLSWNEVGIINLIASIQDADYLGVGDVSSTSGNIGRFIPDHFSTSLTPACDTNLIGATPFTYSGQHADVDITALDLNGNTTTNYDSSLGFAKTITLSNAGVTTGFTLNTLASGFSGGIGTDTDVVYTFPVVTTAPTNLTLRAIDADGVSSYFAADLTTEDTALFHSGRLSLANASGSELLAVSVPFEAQYWNGKAFVRDLEDSCTQVTVPTTGSGLTYYGNITASNTAPTINGVSTGAVTLISGNGNMIFPAPSNKRTGYVDVSVIADSIPWLKFNWKGTGNISPSARVNFGLYSGNKLIIYQREVY